MILIKVAIDLGGNKIEIALVNGKKIKKIMRLKTKKSKSAILNELVYGINFILKDQDKKKIKGIGVSFAGPVLNGYVLNPPNLPFNKFNLEKYLKRKFKLPVKVENDANCFALAELKYGYGKKYKNFVLVAIGTGIGGAIVINKELYVGKGWAGEIGHMIISDSKKKCNAGHNGCFEVMASGSALFDLSKKKMGKGHLAVQLCLMAKKRNSTAKRGLDEIR